MVSEGGRGSSRDLPVHALANEGRRYIVTLSLIGWVQTQNDP